jgi:hypothetical protein
MAGQSHPWQELRGEEADHSERKTTRSTSGSDNGVGNSVAAAKRSAGDEMPIEMDAVTGHATGPAPGEVDPGLGAAGTGCVGAAESAAPVGVQYKVYKRRWFGLVQLTLLNVIVSWDVSVLVSLLLTLAVVLVEDARGIQPFINTNSGRMCSVSARKLLCFFPNRFLLGGRFSWRSAPCWQFVSARCENATMQLPAAIDIPLIMDQPNSP